MEEAKTQREFPHNWMIVISGLELSIRICEVISLLFIPASIFTIVSGSKIMFSIIFARLMLAKPVLRKDYFTVLLMITGVSLVGYSGYVKSQDSNAQESHPLTLKNLSIGLPFTIISNVLSSLIYVIFELVLKEKKTDPLRFCSMSGAYGIVTTSIFVMLATLLPCGNARMCSLGGYLEDPVLALNHIFSSSTVFIYILLFIISVPCYIYSLMYISKNIGSVFLTVAKNTYCISIWVVSVSLGLENIELKSFVYEFLGFVLIILGTLVYNEVLGGRKKKSSIALTNPNNSSRFEQGSKDDEHLLDE